MASARTRGIGHARALEIIFPGGLVMGVFGYGHVPLDILNMCRFHFGLSGNDCTKDEKMAEEVGRLRRPTSCAILRS